MSGTISLNQIRPWPGNPRKRFDDESLKALAESIQLGRPGVARLEATRAGGCPLAREQILRVLLGVGIEATSDEADSGRRPGTGGETSRRGRAEASLQIAHELNV